MTTTRLSPRARTAALTLVLAMPAATPAGARTEWCGIPISFTCISRPRVVFCPADCDADATVSVDELVSVVRIALGEQSSDTCRVADANGDRSVAVDDLVVGARHAMTGCAEARAEQVDAMMRRVAPDDGPAAAVMVTQGDSILFRKVYGRANVETGERATARHVYPLCSISKSFTALAVLSLVEAGRLGLDDPVENYLPELARFTGVTIRHLLQHTSGIPDYYFDPPLTEAVLAACAPPTNACALGVLAAHGDAYFAPGDAFAYTDVGFDSLALIVERISGQVFRDFQQSLVFDRAGMSASFSVPNAQREATMQFVYSYVDLPDGTRVRVDPFTDPTYHMYGAGDVVSNIDDMHRFDRAIAANAIVSPESFRQASTPARLNDGSIPPLLPFESDSTYGLGWIVGSVGEQPYVGHGGAWLGYRTYFARFPETDLSISFMIAHEDDTFRNRLVLPIARLYLPPDGHAANGH